MASVDSLLSVSWLKENLDREDIKVLDGTWSMPGTGDALPAGFIPGAQYFDIDRIASPSPMAHMLPNVEIFSAAVGQLGIRETDHVIIYDRHGLFSAPRVWWTFKMFGHENVSVLDGGLPAWIKAGHPTTPDTLPADPVTYKPGRAQSKVVSKNRIEAQLETRPQILDARSKGRFTGTEAEPRAGLRSGRIPGSRSCPFPHIKTADGFLKSRDDLRELFADLDLTQPIITSCGSGITAAGLAFALDRLGALDVAVYDGSWTEWGASDAPIETGPA